MKLSSSLLILAIAFSPLPVQPLAAQVSPHPPSAVAKDAFIHQMMEDVGIPGLQAVVVKRDKIVWSNSYGDAVLDVPGPRRTMNEHDLILTASTTKLCVTIAVLQQLEKGKLALDDDINRSLPFPVRNPNWPDVPITWRMLLTHTSSIAESTDDLFRALDYWGKDHPLAFDDYVKARFLPGGKYHAYELFRSGKPGSERIYSNDGFSLLAFALEQVTHESFDAYVRREIWTPLKMNESSYSLAGLSPDHLAVGYGAERKPDGTFSFIPAKVFWGRESVSGSIMDYQHSYPEYPVGRTYTNARDFARLILMFLNGGTVDGAKILSPASVDMIFTPSGYRNLDGWKQGIGVNGPLDLRGRQVWGHDGQGRGSVSALYVNRETGMGAFTIANSNYLDESQNYSLVDLDMHLMAWFEDSALDRVDTTYIPAVERGNGKQSLKSHDATSTVPPEPALPSTPAAPSVEAQVLELDRAWGQAYVNGDIGVIDRTLAPDWRGWLDTSGSDKATELAEFKAGKNRSLENIIDNTHVRVYGDTAVVEARERIRFRDKTGEHWLTWHITDVFVREGVRWQVIASHGSTIPNP